MLDLSGWKGFGERVGHHVVCRAIDELNRAVFDDIVNEMEPYVDVLCTSVVLVIFGEHNGGLIVRKESCQVELAREKLQEEGMNPQALLRCMSNGNVFTLRGGERNNFPEMACLSSAMLPSASAYPTKLSLAAPYVNHKSTVPFK